MKKKYTRLAQIFSVLVFILCAITLRYFATHQVIVYKTVILPPTSDLCGAAGCPTTQKVQDATLESHLTIAIAVVMVLALLAFCALLRRKQTSK